MRALLTYVKLASSFDIVKTKQLAPLHLWQCVVDNINCSYSFKIKSSICSTIIYVDCSKNIVSNANKLWLTVNPFVWYPVQTFALYRIFVCSFTLFRQEVLLRGGTTSHVTQLGHCFWAYTWVPAISGSVKRDCDKRRDMITSVFNIRNIITNLVFNVI